MPLSAEDQTKYKALYLQTAREYVTALNENLSLLLSGKETPEAIEILHRSAHSLTSQSKMMEYSQMGNAASLLEEIFQEKQEKNTPLSNELLNLLVETVQHMEACLNVIEKENQENDLSNDVEKLRPFAHVSA